MSNLENKRVLLVLLDNTGYADRLNQHHNVRVVTEEEADRMQQVTARLRRKTPDEATINYIVEHILGWVEGGIGGVVLPLGVSEPMQQAVIEAMKAQEVRVYTPEFEGNTRFIKGIRRLGARDDGEGRPKQASKGRRQKFDRNPRQRLEAGPAEDDLVVLKISGDYFDRSKLPGYYAILPNEDPAICAKIGGQLANPPSCDPLEARHLCGELARLMKSRWPRLNGMILPTDIATWIVSTLEDEMTSQGLRVFHPTSIPRPNRPDEWMIARLIPALSRSRIVAGTSVAA